MEQDLRGSEKKPRGAHLVGSVPLGGAEAVFRAVASRLGTHLRRIPDGETGERTNWVGWQMPLFAGHPDLEAQEPEPGTRPLFRVRPGRDAAGVGFGELGYARAARASFAIFGRLREEGVIPEGTRFQVSLPTPLAPVGLFVHPEDQAALEPAYEKAMRRELDAILDAVPHGSLAIQWDTAVEFGMLEGVFPTSVSGPEDGIVDRLARLGDAVPDGVELGYHLCYGDRGHRHFVEPRDTGRLVRVANRVAAGLDRAPTWVHLPVPRGRSDDGYFAPLQGLRLPAGTELYLGLLHASDGPEGAGRRISAAREATDGSGVAFGVATECGFGRRDPATVPTLLELHATVAAPLRP